MPDELRSAIALLSGGTSLSELAGADGAVAGLLDVFTVDVTEMK